MSDRDIFESKFGKPQHWIEFDEAKNKYVCKYNPIDYHLSIYQARWEAWQSSVNRQGYKLVPVNYECHWCGCTELDGFKDKP